MGRRAGLYKYPDGRRSGALVLGALIVNAVTRIFRQQKGNDLTA
jgi:hypothetical protein